MIAQNREILEDRILRACERCGRRRDEIAVVAVSKTFGVDRIMEAVKAGFLDFGENYVQELEEKRAGIDSGIRWHFIGHLQSNKVRAIVGYIHLIHSVDSFRLAQEIQKRAAQVNRAVDVLVEVHTTDEPTKYGVRPEEAEELVRQIMTLDRVRVLGLMTMGPFSENPDDSRRSFRQLADLRRTMESQGIRLGHLSMGMTHDFEVAIEEGATLLRIGTAIFGERKRI